MPLASGRKSFSPTTVKNWLRQAPLGVYFCDLWRSGENHHSDTGEPRRSETLKEVVMAAGFPRRWVSVCTLPFRLSSIFAVLLLLTKVSSPM